MWLAFLFNSTALPITNGLLPYVAREIYRIDQQGLGFLIASFACGSLAGSIALSFGGRSLGLARLLVGSMLGWYALLAVFPLLPSPKAGMVVLMIAGFAQSLAMVPMSVILLRTAEDRLRGRVMGVRMLAIYGVPIGLMIAGGLIERIGFAWAASLYCVIGVGLTGAIALYWHAALWPRDAPELRVRVVAALALLVGAKVINIAVPFLYKHAVDTLSGKYGLVTVPVMLILAFFFSATWFVQGAMAAHLPRLLEAAGASQTAAIAASALVGPAQVGARLVEFSLLRWVHPLNSARFAAILHPIGAAVLILFGAPAAAAFALLHGAGNGMLTIAKGTLPLALFGPNVANWNTITGCPYANVSWLRST